mmetsp:Transcript_21276/g.61039  ORF Transcript_21276/g.61039 Transcript_21276/m.61039 type:complete len:465 (-) Transcript_21276:194-1588(-)
MDFFNKLTGDGDKKPGKGRANATSGGRVGSGSGGGSGPQFKNPFAGLARPGGNKNYRGGGQSLGGSKPGRIIRIELPMAGPLGVKVEKRQGGAKTAIVSQVLPDTQAAAAQLQRGDVICVADTGGEVEMLYEDFLKMAASDVRPLIFDIRRIDGVGVGAAAATAGAIGSGGGTGTGTGSSTADAYAKRQAVIAAAEARDKAHKKKTKPIAKGTGKDLTIADRKRIEEQREEQARRNATEGIGAATTSDESKRAVAAAKAGEAQHAAALGYNPYETNKVSAGQARTATVAVTHGALGDAGGSDSASGGNAPTSAGASSSTAAPGAVAPPSNPVSAASLDADNLTNINPQFGEAFEAVALHTSNNETATQALTIMRKLIVNATTKGQTGPEETSAKFRRVRLSNPKIKAAITDVHGALDLMMSVGFVLSENEDDGETYLVFPPGSSGPSWLPQALKKMENYTQVPS